MKTPQSSDILSSFATPARLAVAALATAGLLALSPTAPAQTADQLNDLEIAHVAYTAGDIDIRYAHLALALSESPAVRDFAETMIRDHGAVNRRALALVEKLDITPQDNPVSRQLSEQAAGIRAELMALDGDAFDRRYAANELAYHQFVNGAVEGVFIPNAQNAELKALLGAALETFKAHEAHAEAIDATLGG